MSMLAPNALNRAHHYFRRFVCVPLLAMLLLGCDGPERKSYRELVATARSSLKPELLQSQTREILNRHGAGETVPAGEIPAELAKLKGVPPDVYINTWNDSSEKGVMFIWGNGFAHWGMIVGGPTFRLPNVEYLKVDQWAPGIGFFFQ